MREFEADSLDSSRSPSPTNVYGESFTIQRLQKAVNRLEVEHDRILRDNMRLETELESAQKRLKARISLFLQFKYSKNLKGHSRNKQIRVNENSKALKCPQQTNTVFLYYHDKLTDFKLNPKIDERYRDRTT